MPPRAKQVLEDTVILLNNGKQIQTKYDHEQKRHIVSCDICNKTISLSATASPYQLERHRSVCRERTERQAAKKFQTSEAVLDGEGSFQLQLLFHPTSTSSESNNTCWTGVECPGQWVRWAPGSIWETYPFRLHKSQEVGWRPIAIDSADNGMVLRAKNCWRRVNEIDSEDSPSPCIVCKGVPHTTEFKAVVERAQNAKDHTPWMYLTDLQKETLMRQMANTIRRLRGQINNNTRSRHILRNKIQEYKRIMMLIASNDIPRLTQLISVSLRHGSSATAIAAQIERAVEGLYSPRGGFTQRELDVAFLCQAIGGRRLLYALNHSHGLASERTIRRNNIVPRLLPSNGVPMAEEIKQNITSFFDPSIKPPPSAVNGILPGNTLAFDGISIQKKCRYCPKRGVILGLCREHSHNINTIVTNLDIIEEVHSALTGDDEGTKVCWGTEATVVAVAPYSQIKNYSPTPIVISPTDKTEKADSLCQWIETVIDTWNTHENGAIQNGSLWSIASDGDATFRQARNELCNRYQLDPTSQLGQMLGPLLGLNLYTSKNLITATCDPKHIFKRFATLLRGTGLTVKDHFICSNDIREQLIVTLKISETEVNDIMNTLDKQNVPVKLLRYLCTLQGVQPPADEFRYLRYERICFVGKLFGFFLEPFVDVRMDLDSQLQSLLTFAHLAVALQLEHGTAFLTRPLYADTQATIKNIYFVVARLQLISPTLKFYLIHEGTDRLKHLFGDCRTLDHARNFDILQLSEKMAIACLINASFERNPDLNRGQRHLDLSSTAGVDHVNPSSWLGDVCVGNVDLAVAWNKGRDVAVATLETLFGHDKVQGDFKFSSIFAHPDRDILRPKGVFIGVRPMKDELRQAEVIHHVPAAQNPHPNQLSESSIDGIEEGLEEELDVGGLEEGLPDDPNECLHAPRSFVVDGREFNIDSAVSSLHPTSYRQMSDRIYRVRNWNIDHIDTPKLDGLFDRDDAINIDLLKAYDIIGFLIRSAGCICFAVMEVKGFIKLEGKKKMYHLSAQCSKLASRSSGMKVFGQIIKLTPSVKQDGYLEWAKEFIVPLGTSRERGKKQSMTIEVASHLIHPLNINMVSYPAEPRATRLRWAVSTDDLEREMLNAWNLLSPDFSNNLTDFELIPTLDHAQGLPYRDRDGQTAFIVKNVPNCWLKRNIPLSRNQKVHCFVCGDVVKLYTMREHVGKHILWDMRGQKNQPNDSDITSLMGVMPCGFCGIEGCTTKLTEGHDDVTITSTCIYYSAIDYPATLKGKSADTLCSNVPIHCGLCPPSSEGEPQTIWKYNALMHIIVDHQQMDPDIPNLCIFPEVPFSMQVNMHISRVEEAAFGIKVEHTMNARADFNLMNSDDLMPDIPEVYLESEGAYEKMAGKRARAETQSTTKPPSKKHHI